MKKTFIPFLFIGRMPTAFSRQKIQTFKENPDMDYRTSGSTGCGQCEERFPLACPSAKKWTRHKKGSDINTL